MLERFQYSTRSAGGNSYICIYDDKQLACMTQTAKLLIDLSVICSEVSGGSCLFIRRESITKCKKLWALGVWTTADI